MALFKMFLFCLFATFGQGSSGVMAPEASSRSCEGKNQLGIIGKFNNVNECARHVSQHPASCAGGTFMFADGYGMAWGCRCCTPDESGWTPHNLWKIYQLPSVVSLRASGKSCEGANQKGMITKRFPDARGCGRFLAANPNLCPQKTFMLADGYGTSWGCRCCTSNPNGWKTHKYWKIYQIPADVTLAGRGKSCEGPNQKGMISKSFSKAKDCGRYIAENPNVCPERTFMFANGYGKSWGCRCCTSNANGWGPHNYWNIYQAGSARPMHAESAKVEGLENSYSRNCPPVCLIYCPSGIQTDDRGCPVCMCRNGIGFHAGHLAFVGAFISVMGVGYWFVKRQNDSAELASLLDEESV